MLFVRGYLLSSYATDGEWSYLKCVQLCTRGGDVTPHVYVRTLTISFHVLACLSYGALHYLQKLNLTLIQIRCVRQERRLFFFYEISLYHNEIRFYYFKLFLRTKVSQNAFSFSQIES